MAIWQWPERSRGSPPCNSSPPLPTLAYSNRQMVMTRQQLWLFLIAAGMCVHALVMGRALESIFGIVAFAWGWMAWAALYNRLADAEAMAVSMTVILFASALAFIATSSDTSNVTAHLSLALIPAVVGFACVAFFIRHMRQPPVEESLIDWSTAVAMAAAAKIRKGAKAVPQPITVDAGGLQFDRGANDHTADADGRAA
jgi:hypothetical protein